MSGRSLVFACGLALTGCSIDDVAAPAGQPPVIPSTEPERLVRLSVDGRFLQVGGAGSFNYDNRTVVFWAWLPGDPFLTASFGMAVKLPSAQITGPVTNLNWLRSPHVLGAGSFDTSSASLRLDGRTYRTSRSEVGQISIDGGATCRSRSSGPDQQRYECRYFGTFWFTASAAGSGRTIRVEGQFQLWVDDVAK